jgi:chorismate mutase
MPSSSDQMLTKPLHDLIALLESDVLDMPDTPSQEDLAPWRDRIDALDRAIIRLLNERAICANAIGHIKKRIGLPVYVPSREQDVLRNVTASNEGPLPNEAVKRLFERVIDETRSLERQLYQDAPEPSHGSSE